LSAGERACYPQRMSRMLLFSLALAACDGAPELPLDLATRIDLGADLSSILDLSTTFDLAPACPPLSPSSYGMIGISGPPSSLPAATHPDVNLLLRKWRRAVGESPMIFDPHHPEDPNGMPPQLNTLFSDRRVPAFANLYQVQQVDWSCACFHDWVTSPPVTLIGFGTNPGEELHVPESVYVIDPPDYAAMVLYAADNTITLKYTTSDTVADGYTIHLAGVCVDPALLALYQTLDAAGRKQLPGLHRGQAFGRARGVEIEAAIRDTGSWMDPRWCPDWWTCP
jgi:hypothetical protein